MADRVKGDQLQSLFKPPVRRPIAPSHAHSHAISWARNVVQGCRSQHGSCRSLSNAKEPPKRLLSLKQLHSSGTVSVLRVEAGTQPKYTTLSYCWGTPADGSWVRYHCTVQKGSLVFDFKHMPATLRDAINVVSELGYEYLWIDALCILQHDRKDWDEEGARMADIYEGCELMLCASNCNHTNDGFLQQRLKFEDCIVPVPLRIDESTTSMLHFEIKDVSYVGDAARGPVSTRAWCLQEQRLAPRVLHFGKFQLHFECKAGKWQESEPQLDLKPRTTFYANEYNERQPSVRDLYDRELSASKPLANVSTVSQWNAIVADYTTRRLTHGSDKLIALSGLAENASKILQCPYLAGVWQKDLHVGLSWHVTRSSGFMSSGNHLLTSQTQTPARSTSYRAPSWSWASMDGPVTFLLETDLGTAHLVTSSLEYQDSSTKLSSTGLFGAVTACQLTLGAKVKNVPASMLSANAVMRPHQYLSRSSDSIGWYAEDERRTLEGDLICMKLATLSHGFSPGMAPENIFLVLACLPGDKYSRIGAGSILETEYFDDVPFAVITLV